MSVWLSYGFVWVIGELSINPHKPPTDRLWFSQRQNDTLSCACFCFCHHLPSLHHGECVARLSPCVLFLSATPFSTIPFSFPASLAPPFLTSASPPHTLSRSASHYFYPPECGPAPLHANRKPQVLFCLDSTQAQELLQSVSLASPLSGQTDTLRGE